MAVSQIVCLIALAAFSLCNATPVWQRRIVKREADPPVVEFSLDEKEQSSLRDLATHHQSEVDKALISGVIVNYDYPHDCNNVITDHRAPLSIRSSCPWIYKVEHNPLRYPSTFLVAVKRCPNTSCLGDTTGKMECVPINQELEIIESHPATGNGNLVFQTKTLHVPVGFTCAGRRSASNNAVPTTTQKPVTTTEDIFNK